MLANREGRFLARVGERGIGESRNGAVQLSAEYILDQEQTADGYQDISSEGMRITGYHYLTTTDGTLNETTMKSLKAAFGWDGRDPFWLQDSELPADLLVQVVLAYEPDQNGQQKMRVKWVDNKDSTGGGVTKADANTKKGIMAKFGAKFRAAAGGSPATPPKPAGKPSVPAAAPKAKPKPCTMETAWNDFQAVLPDGATKEQAEATWFAAIEKLFPGKEADALTDAEFGALRDALLAAAKAAAAKNGTIAPEKPLVEDEIPF